MASFKLRRMTEEDLDDVFAIEIVDNPHHWSKQIFLDCLKVKYDCFVMENNSGDKLLGFAILSNMVDETHLLNIAIAKPSRRNGFAQAFLNFLFDHSKEQGVHHMLLEVRKSNKGAIALYVKNQFKQVGLRRDYYSTLEGREDALVLRKNL